MRHAFDAASHHPVIEGGRFVRLRGVPPEPTRGLPAPPEHSPFGPRFGFNLV